MKRFGQIILIIIFLTISSIVNAQIRYCGYTKGMWGEWESDILSMIKINGTVNDFVLYASHHPSNYFFRVKLKGFTNPSNQEKRLHKKLNTWYEYQGEVEYYEETSKDYPYKMSPEEYAQRFPFTTTQTYSDQHYDRRKRTVNAVIRIAPYNKHPQVYNVFFNGVGVGIWLP